MEQKLREDMVKFLTAITYGQRHTIGDLIVYYPKINIEHVEKLLKALGQIGTEPENKLPTMPLFDKFRIATNAGITANYSFDKLDPVTQYWFRNLCAFFEKELK